MESTKADGAKWHFFSDKNCHFEFLVKSTGNQGRVKR